MEFYLFLNPEHVPGDDSIARLRAHVRQVELARGYGMTGVAVGQHLSTEGMQWFPPIPLLSYLAARFPDMRLGTTVLLLPYFNPVLVAESMAFLDVLTEGRTFLGVAAGWNQHEFEVLNIPRQRRGKRLAEGLEVIKRLWMEDTVTFHGEEFHLNHVSLSLKPVQKPRPPIWIGASGTAKAREAASLGDALVLSSHIPLSTQEGIVAAYRQARRDMGQPVGELPCLRNIFVAETYDAALREAAPYLEQSYGHFAEWGLFQDVLGKGDTNRTFSDVVLDRVIIGGPEEVIRGIETVRERLGITTLVLRIQWYGMPDALVERSLQLIGEKVLPFIR